MRIVPTVDLAAVRIVPTAAFLRLTPPAVKGWGGSGSTNPLVSGLFGRDAVSQATSFALDPHTLEGKSVLR